MGCSLFECELNRYTAHYLTSLLWRTGGGVNRKEVRVVAYALVEVGLVPRISLDESSFVFTLCSLILPEVVMR